MIGDLISKLENNQAQFRDFGALMAKILFKGREEAELILRLLNKYVLCNSGIEILDIVKITQPITKEEIKAGLKVEELAYLVCISFKCSWCKNMSEEETNLSCVWNPARSEELPICSFCRDKAEEISRDNAYQADQEYEKLEKERELQEKNLSVIEEEYEHENKKHEHKSN